MAVGEGAHTLCALRLVCCDVQQHVWHVLTLRLCTQMSQNCSFSLFSANFFMAGIEVNSGKLSPCS